MRINYRLPGLMSFFLLIGICAGAFYEVSMSGDGKATLESALGGFVSGGDSQIDSSAGLSIFAAYALSFAKAYLPFIFLAWLSGWVPPLVIAMPCHMLFKGFSTGFSSAMMIECLGFKGALLILRTSFLPLTLQLVVVMLLYSVSASLAAERFRIFLASAACSSGLFKRRKSRKSRKSRNASVSRTSVTRGEGIHCLFRRSAQTPPRTIRSSASASKRSTTSPIQVKSYILIYAFGCVAMFILCIAEAFLLQLAL